jgi:hypothetical protein
MATQATVTVPASGSAGVKLTNRATNKVFRFDNSTKAQTVVVRPVADIVIGGSDVAVATGVTLTAGLTYSIVVGAGEDLYAVSAATATTAKVVRIG